MRGGVANRRHREVKVEQRPIEMAGGWPFHRGDLLHRGLLEPREISVGDKQFFIIQEQPEALGRYQSNFNFRSGYARHGSSSLGVNQPKPMRRDVAKIPGQQELRLGVRGDGDVERIDCGFLGQGLFSDQGCGNGARLI